LEGENVHDDAFAALVVWAALDAFWAHASGTIKAHVAEAWFMGKYVEGFGFSHMLLMGLITLYQHGGKLQVLLLHMQSWPEENYSSIQSCSKDLVNTDHTLESFTN
jgi:hypothetical protein